MKVTFDDLLAKKLKKEKAATEQIDILVPSMGKELTFVRPTDKALVEAMDLADSGTASGAIEGMKHLIYTCCPTLQSAELHSYLEIADPDEVVGKIFDIADINAVGQALSDMGSIGETREEIKN